MHAEVMTLIFQEAGLNLNCEAFHLIKNYTQKDSHIESQMIFQRDQDGG